MNITTVSPFLFQTTATRGTGRQNPQDPPAPQSPSPASKPQASGLAEAKPILDGFHAMEAYYSWDGKQIIFQGAEKAGREVALQTYVWSFPKAGEKPAAPKALTTSPHSCECTFFSPDGKYVVYNTVPPDAQTLPRDFGGHPYFYDTRKETFLGKLTPEGLQTERLTTNDAYEAETSFSPVFRNRPGYAKDGVYILYTSSRSGSLDLYLRRVLDTRGERTELDSTDKSEKPITDVDVQITNTPTLQEGGAFFMPDGRIVYRAWEFDPKDPQKDKWERARINYRPMQLYIFNPATKETNQLTSGSSRHWAPFPHPSGDKIVFAKRDFAQTDNNFDIFVLHLADGRQERITNDPLFDGYPVFHPSGDRILFSRYFADQHRFQLMEVPYKN